MVKATKARESIINKAEELAREYEAKYKGCAQCTFLAIVDALRWGGIELISAETEDSMYPAISMLSAGVCMTAEGTCGAITGGTMALGLALGKPRSSADVAATRCAAATIRNTLIEKAYQDYRSILCKDIQRKYFGKAWNLADDKMAHEFLSISTGCVIMDIAKLVTGYILDEVEKGNVQLPKQ